jgi:hypothetical protein
MKLCVYLLIPALLIGCSSNQQKVDKSGIGVVFNSNPQGALVECEGRPNGYTPTIAGFTYTAEEKASGEAFIPSCQVKWSTGATVNINKTYISSKNHGLSFSANNKSYVKGLNGIVQRPNVAGYEKDANFALKVASLKAQQAQVRASRQQAIAAQRQASAAYQANIISNNAIQQQNFNNRQQQFYQNMNSFQRNNNNNLNTWGSSGRIQWKPITP